MKRKRVSKKNKISWRKNVDITDVEEFLEDQRLEERLGPPLSTLKDEELFHLDTGGTEETKVELSKKEKSKLRLANPRCFEILKPHTKVPDPVTQRNRVRSKEERTNLLVKLKEETRRKNGILKAKEKEVLKHKMLSKKVKENQIKKGEVRSDIWEESDKILGSENLIDDKVEMQTKKNFGLFKKRVAPLVTKKQSLLPSIEPPHPGISYNPSFEDHQNLLKSISEKEVKIIKKEQKINRSVKNIFKKVPEKKATKAWLEEMSQGLDKIKEEDESDNEYKPINPPVQNKKKTVQQRRKRNEQKMLKYFQTLSKIEKKKITDLHRLRFLKENLKKLDEKEELARTKKLEQAKGNETKTKRIGPHKFEEEDLDFNLPEEIVGNLRKIKTGSNLLVDRFKSLQKRNVIAPSKIVVSKRPRTKRYTKPGFKDDWKTTIATVNFKPDKGQKR